MTQRATITISTRKDIRDQFAEYAESQGLTFSTWAMLELKKVVEKGKRCRCEPCILCFLSE